MLTSWRSYHPLGGLEVGCEKTAYVWKGQKEKDGSSEARRGAQRIVRIAHEEQWLKPAPEEAENRIHTHTERASKPPLCVQWPASLPSAWFQQELRRYTARRCTDTEPSAQNKYVPARTQVPQSPPCHTRSSLACGQLWVPLSTLGPVKRSWLQSRGVLLGDGETGGELHLLLRPPCTSQSTSARLDPCCCPFHTDLSQSSH